MVTQVDLIFQKWWEFKVLVTIGLNLVAHTFYDYCIYIVILHFFISSRRFWAPLAVLGNFYLFRRKLIDKRCLHQYTLLPLCAVPLRVARWLCSWFNIYYIYYLLNLKYLCTNYQVWRCTSINIETIKSTKNSYLGH